MPSEPSFGPDS